MKGCGAFMAVSCFVHLFRVKTLALTAELLYAVKVCERHSVTADS